MKVRAHFRHDQIHAAADSSGEEIVEKAPAIVMAISGTYASANRSRRNLVRQRLN